MLLLFHILYMYNKLVTIYFKLIIIDRCPNLGYKFKNILLILKKKKNQLLYDLQ